MFDSLLMQSLKYLLISYLFCVLPSNSYGQEKWKRFAPSGQKFELLVPGEMKYAEKNLLTDLGTLNIKTYMHQGFNDDPNFIYIINYVDYPKHTFDIDSMELIKEFFDVSIETNIKDLEGELIYEAPSTYLKHPGIIFRANYNSGKAILKSRMIIVGDRFYSLQVYTLVERSLNKEMDIFLDSFKIE